MSVAVEATTRTKGEETRAFILDHALGRAGEVGLYGLTIGNLAKEVGMSKSGLFAHFRSKEDLQVAVLRTAVDRFIERVVAPSLREPRGEPRVRAFFESWLVWAESMPGGCIFVSALNELEARPGPARDLVLSTQRDWISTLSGAARIAVAEGHFSPALDLDQFAWELYAIILAYHHSARLLHEPRAGERARTSFDRLLRASRP